MIQNYIIDEDNFDLAGDASSSVKKNLTLLGVDPKIVKRVAVAMYEAEINAFIHGSGGHAIVEIEEGRIKIVIEDQGKGIEDINQAMEEGFSTADERIRRMGFGAGMGLPNIKKNSDYLDIKSELGNGTKVEIIINFT